MSAARSMPAGERLPWVVLAVALLLPLAVLVRNAGRSPGMARQGAEELGDYGVVPDFSLVERSGRAVSRADLAGAPWVADFVYTSCESSCPVLSGEMARLAGRIDGRARLVSFSVDPERDTPSALSAYADRFGAPATGWLFLTGDAQTLRRLISHGFHLAVADAAGGMITHSEKIALVDRDLHIRRYYDGGSGEWIDQAVRDLAELARAR
jgi:protein SCO1